MMVSPRVDFASRLLRPYLPVVFAVAEAEMTGSTIDDGY
jgi:hypothetical protein